MNISSYSNKNNAYISESDSPCNLTLPSKKRRLEDSINLPETCTLLRTKSGGRVYVVGTAHFSQESQVKFFNSKEE